MQIQSSYIFLPNPYNKRPSQWEDEKRVLHIETGRSVYAYVKKAFPNMTSREIKDGYSEYEYSFPVYFEEKSVDISIISKNVVESYYVNVIARGTTKAQLIKALGYVHSALFATEIDDDFISIVSYDAVSEHYCNKLYPKLNKLERNLRKLMFNIYVLNFGKEYFQATTTKEMQDKAKRIIQAKGNVEKREIQYIKQFFYSLEYADIQQLLFVPRWTRINEEHTKSLLEAHEDLSKLSDEELRVAINDISPKSDWERFFNEKFQGVNVEGGIEAVRGVRNSVAHCKFLEKDQYNSCNKIINALNKALNRAIAITEKEDFDEKNAEYLRKAMSGVSSGIHELVSRFSEMLQGVTPYHTETYKGAMEATSTLAKVLTDNITPINFSGTFKDIASWMLLPDDDESKDEEVAEDTEKSEGNEDI